MMQESKSSVGFSSTLAGQMGDNIRPVENDERAPDPKDLTFEKATKVFGGARAEEGEETQSDEPDDRLERWVRFRRQTLENVAQIYTTLRDTPNQPTHQAEMDAVIQTTISLQSIRQAMEDTRGYQALRMMARTEIGGQHGQADLLAQNLSMQLYNPRNRCFANSVVRMICWVPVQRPHEARSIWGQMADTFEGIGTTREGRLGKGRKHAKSVGEIPTKQASRCIRPTHEDAWEATNGILEKSMVACWTKRDNGSQGINSNWNPFPKRNGGRHFGADCRRVDETRRRPSISEESVNSGATNQPVCMDQRCLDEAPTQLHFGDQIELPVSDDGQTTASETYKIGGLIMHSGADHHSGHYTTIHKFHDINWFADDDAPPSPLTEIHERHRREVVQVWCVKEQGDGEGKTERKKQKAAEQEPFNPKRRRGENQLYIQMANVTMMGKEVVKWIQSQPTVPIMLVETHMQGEALIQRERMLARQGWKTISVEANKSERGGTNGGFMIVHPISCHMHKVEHYMIEGCGWLAVQWQFDNWAIIVVLVYFKTGEGIQGQTNAQLWARLTTFTQHLQLPYVVIGDFNVEPGEVAATTIVEHMGGSLLATGQETTLQGSELDWSIVSKTLKPACRLQVQWEVPFKPHGMLMMSIEQEVIELQVAQLIKYPPIPRLEFVRKKWEECEQSVQVEVLEDHISNVDQKYGEWSAQAEAFVSQNMPGAKQGRGVRIDIEYKPLVDGVKNWVWKRGSLAYWSQFHSRITAGMNWKGVNGKGRLHIEQMLWQVEKHWVTQDDVEAFKERVQSIIWHWNEHEANLVMCQIEASEEEIKRTTLEEETDQYRQWLKSGEAKGLRSLFRSLSKEQAAYVRPFQDKPFLERMPLRVKQWTDIWGRLESQVHIPGLRDLIKAGRDQGAQLEEISVTHALRVAKRLPHKANGIDGISNDLLRQLPYEGMRSLVQMMEAVEKTGFVPVQWALALVVLIPKNETIERPIALLATTYRFWTKLRTQAIKKWQEELRWRMPWERSTPGSQCLHIAVGRLLRTEIQKAGGKFVVSLLLDMSNFYDRVSLVKLTERFKEVQFPPLAAMVCMQIYSGRRVLDADGECSEPIWPERGILAGCPYAPLCAKVYLSRAMQAFHEKFPQVSADLWVDDCSFDVSGDDPEAVAQ